MKIHQGELVYPNICEYPNVAINLETNEIERFADCLVEKVKAKIVIE